MKQVRPDKLLDLSALSVDLQCVSELIALLTFFNRDIQRNGVVYVIVY